MVSLQDRQDFAAVLEQFRAQGLDLTQMVAPGLGHGVPSDLLDRVRKWLQQG